MRSNLAGVRKTHELSCLCGKKVLRALNVKRASCWSCKIRWRKQYDKNRVVVRKPSRLARPQLRRKVSSNMTIAVRSRP